MSTETIGKSDGIGELYSQHHAWLHSWLRQKLGCTHQAADIAQDTFIRVMTGRRMEGLREPRGYLTAVAKGLMVDQFRRQAIETAYLEALAVFPEPEAMSMENRAIVVETLVAIDRMLDELGPRTRDVFLLAQLEGLTQAEIGHRLQLSLPTVRKHLVRAYTECLLLAVQD